MALQHAARGFGHNHAGHVFRLNLQPALVDVLTQRVRDRIGIGGDAGAVPPDGDAVEPLLDQDFIAQHGLEIRELRPLIEQRIEDGDVKIRLAEQEGEVIE